MNISAVLALVAIGAVLGCVLGIANKYLVVEEDNRVTEVIEMLPGANCGGCGCNEGGCNSILWIIILLSCCCGNNGGFCGNNGCGGGNDCLWIILLLLCCGGCGNGNGFC